MIYKITDNHHTATFTERKRARLYYQALNALVPANKIVVEVYDAYNLLIADEVTYIRS